MARTLPFWEGARFWLLGGNIKSMQHFIGKMRTAGLLASTLLLGVTACAAAPETAVATKAEAVVQQAATQPKAVAAPSLPAASRTRIEVSFKLDPRLSGGTYGGEHWVSPANFSSAVQAGTEANVEVRVRALDSLGAPMTIGPTWSAADPTMLIVSPISPGATDHVLITVKRIGETKLVIAASGATKVLCVKASAVANGRGVQVDIAQ